MAKMLEFLATPLVGTPAGGFGFVCKPAAMPPTWVPWSHKFSPLKKHWPTGWAAPGPDCVGAPFGHRVTPPPPPPELEKQASAITLPLRNSWLDSAPVSRTATANPCPVAPAA